MRAAEAAAWPNWVTIMPNMAIGKNRYIRYMLNSCHSPRVSVPRTIC